MRKSGTKKKTIVGRVQTHERANEILNFCDRRGWKIILGIEPDKEEDISDLEKLINPPKPVLSNKVDRNAPCPCGSGKKSKKCCFAN
jgi:SWIM/SEC-C metal-binding protein